MIDNNQTFLIKAGGIISGSSIMSNMVIFSDIGYMFLAIMGGVISLIGMVHEIAKGENDYKSIVWLFGELFKSFMLGAVLTPMFFMLLMSAGQDIISQITGLQIHSDIFSSFWWLMSLIMSWYAPLIWDNILKKVSNIFWRGGRND